MVIIEKNIIEDNDFVKDGKTIFGAYISTFIDLQKEFREKGYEEPYKLYSNSLTKKKSELGVHFHSQVGFTERDRIESKYDLLDWEIDDTLADNILVLSTVTKEEKREWRDKEIRRSLKNIEGAIKNINSLLDLGY